MDLVTALTKYRASLTQAMEVLDQFPDELKEFEVEERRHLEAAIQQIAQHLHEATNTDQNLPFAPEP